MSFPRYSSYKPSGVEWLGDIPEHWSVLPLKRLASLQSGDAITADAIVESGDYPVFGGNGLRGFTNQFTHDGEFVLIGRQGALCGNVNFARGRFWASEHAVVATPIQPLDTRWFGEMLAAMNLNQYSTSAAQPGLSVDLVRSLRTAVPPETEQGAIAAFLDRETAKIDALVAEQERLIELLKEKRQAVISHAVTKGLNPDAPMRPSGVEWLGDVPAHWVVGALGYYAGLSTGGTPDRADEDFWDGDISWVKTGEINYNDVLATEETITQEGLSASSAKVLPAGTLLMALYGQGATRGRVALLGVAAACNQACAAITPDRRLSAGFLRWYFEAAYEHIRDAGNETTQMNLSLDYVRSLRVPVPPLSEQASIVSAIASSAAGHDALISAALSAVVLLKARRAAVISAAVTGQIDVRALVSTAA